MGLILSVAAADLLGRRDRQSSGQGSMNAREGEGAPAFPQYAVLKVIEMAITDIVLDHDDGHQPPPPETTR